MFYFTLRVTVVRAIASPLQYNSQNRTDIETAGFNPYFWIKERPGVEGRE